MINIVRLPLFTCSSKTGRKDEQLIENEKMRQSCPKDKELERKNVIGEIFRLGLKKNFHSGISFFRKDFIA